MTPEDDLRPPPGPAERAQAWIEAEARQDDAALLALRDLEQACAGLPPVIDGARRGRLLAADPLATTWEAWRLDDGARLLLRCLHPRWLSDPVLRRRFGAASARGAAVQARLDGAWPHLRSACPGAPVLDRLPIEDPPSTLVLARLLGAGLEGLAALHGRGRVHGGPLAAFLVDGPGGARLHWMDGLAPGRGPGDDLRGLAAVIAALDPEATDPVGQLAGSWLAAPPPLATDGLRLLREALAGDLLAHRHHLAMVGRRLDRRDRATRLAELARGLDRALPPPRATACLHASPDGLLVLVHSDGHAVHGGTAALPGTSELPRVWNPREGLDAQAARVLQRAWATRDAGDPAARARAQQALGGTDADAARLVRWLSAKAALRRGRLLLEHQAGNRGAPPGRLSPGRP